MAKDPLRLNRIYIRHRDIAVSLYRRSKETQFTSTDVMRLHWDRQGKRAKKWAEITIARMRDRGFIETCKPTKHEDAPKGDGRRRWYRFTEKALKQWNLHDPNAWSSSTTDTSKKWNPGAVMNGSSNPPE